MQLTVRGVVQGVGFRPFVRRAALARGLRGSVANRRDGVHIEVEGSADAVEQFTRSLETELPLPAMIRATERAIVADRGDADFVILPSEGDEAATTYLPPDLAPCAACLAELFDPSDRRFRYPFTSCARCGPRHSIALGLPYDREATTMAGFAMCVACAHEYHDPDDRRHHAQPIACPDCGPRLRLIGDGLPELGGEPALSRAERVIASGGIVALRGVGGFQLVTDATSETAVERLRRRKRRPDKPLAVLFADLAAISLHAHVRVPEAALLGGAATPIVVLERREGSSLASKVCRGLSRVGAMLPASPLHALLAHDLARPLVCTSGNLSSEPICVETDEALALLGPIADAILTHDRPIARPLDDSVQRVDRRGRTTTLRRARGYTPAVVAEGATLSDGIAFGAHLKSTLCLAHRGALVASQHLGDGDNVAVRTLVDTTARDLLSFYAATPTWIACDAHPEYATTRTAEAFARRTGLPLRRIQHHRAHVAACVAEHARTEPRLAATQLFALVWDGTGWGDDGTSWGGEAFGGAVDALRRVASLRPFPLPGGDAAAREPRRAVLGVLQAFVPAALDRALAAWPELDRTMLRFAVEQGLHAPSCSSIGRLFDAVAGLLGLCPRPTYEGQAAMALEQLAQRAPECGAYPLPIVEPPPGAMLDVMIDPAPLIMELLAELDHGRAPAQIARRFHRALVDLTVALAARASTGEVVLTGGCFQNALLADGARRALERAGHRVWMPSALPCNDGGISVGQAWLAGSAG